LQLHTKTLSLDGQKGACSIIFSFLYKIRYNIWHLVRFYNEYGITDRSIVPDLSCDSGLYGLQD
jgi:hypothetical protein